MNIDGALPTIMVAIVTTESVRIKGGGVPVFIEENEKGLYERSASLESILDASAHEIDPHTIIIVSH